MANLDETVFNAVQWVEAQAWRSVAEDAPIWLRSALQVQICHAGPCLVLSSARISSLLFNRVLGLDHHDAVDPAIIDFVPMLAATVGRPGWTSLVARDRGEVVGAAALFVQDGVASLAGASTRPSHRRRGVQGALMARRIEIALDQGCTTIGAETGEPVQGEPNSSGNNMQRCGLRVVGTIENYTRPETRWAHAG